MCGLFRNLALCKDFRKLIKESITTGASTGVNFSLLLLADDPNDDSLLDNINSTDVDLAFDLLGLMHTLWLVKNNSSNTVNTPTKRLLCFHFFEICF